MDDKKFLDLIRMEIDVFGLNELQENANEIDGLSGDGRKNFLATVSTFKEVWDKLIKYVILKQSLDLQKYNDAQQRMDDIARGGINSLSVLHELMEQMDAEHKKNIEEARESFDPHQPLPEM